MPVTAKTWPESIDVRPVAAGEIGCFLDVFEAAWGWLRLPGTGRSAPLGRTDGRQRAPLTAATGHVLMSLDKPGR